MFIEKGPHASEKLQQDIRHDMTKVYECYFPLQPSKDIAFEIGRILMGLKDFAAAAQHFRHSHKIAGHTTSAGALSTQTFAQLVCLKIDTQTILLHCLSCLC